MRHYHNRESVFFQWGADNENPSAIYALCFAGQGAYRISTRKVKGELINVPLIQIANGVQPMPEISRAQITWCEGLDCIRQLGNKPTSPELVEKCSIAYLQGLREVIAANVDDEYLGKRSIAIPETKDVWNEWLKLPIDAYGLG